MTTEEKVKELEERIQKLETIANLIPLERVKELFGENHT